MAAASSEDVSEGEYEFDPNVTEIFICKKCWCPVGDSRDLQFIYDGTLGLRAVTKHVEIQKEKLKSTKSDYFDSTYQLLNCKGCDAVIGELYVSTPRLLMYKRDVFNLNLNSISSYTLEDRDKQYGPQHEGKMILESYDFLKCQLKKTQKLLGALQQRVSELEGTVHDPHPPDSPSSECVHISL